MVIGIAPRKKSAGKGKDEAPVKRVATMGGGGPVSIKGRRTDAYVSDLSGKAQLGEFYGPEVQVIRKGERISLTVEYDIERSEARYFAKGRKNEELDAHAFKLATGDEIICGKESVARIINEKGGVNVADAQLCENSRAMVVLASDNVTEIEMLDGFSSIMINPPFSLIRMRRCTIGFLSGSGAVFIEARDDGDYIYRSPLGAIKVTNVSSGQVLETSFNPAVKVETVVVKQDGIYLKSFDSALPDAWGQFSNETNRYAPIAAMLPSRMRLLLVRAGAIKERADKPKGFTDNENAKHRFKMNTLDPNADLHETARRNIEYYQGVLADKGISGDMKMMAEAELVKNQKLAKTDMALDKEVEIEIARSKASVAKFLDSQEPERKRIQSMLGLPVQGYPPVSEGDRYVFKKAISAAPSMEDLMKLSAMSGKKGRTGSWEEKLVAGEEQREGTADLIKKMISAPRGHLSRYTAKGTVDRTVTYKDLEMAFTYAERGPEIGFGVVCSVSKEFLMLGISIRNKAKDSRTIYPSDEFRLVDNDGNEMKQSGFGGDESFAPGMGGSSYIAFIIPQNGKGFTLQIGKKGSTTETVPISI